MKTSFVNCLSSCGNDKEVIPAGEGQVELQRQIGELLNELKDIFQGIYLIKDLSPKTSDTIVSYGERLSSIIAAQLTGAEWFDSRRFIKTEKKHFKHVLDTELTNELVRETFRICPDGCWFRDLSLRIRRRAR